MQEANVDTSLNCSGSVEGVVGVGRDEIMKNAFLMSLCLMSIAACAATTTFDPTQVTIPGRCGGDVTTTQSRVKITNLGVTLSPLGRLTTVGNLPTGGALTLDGKQYWAVDSGFGLNDVKIVDMASGVVIQTLPLPGAFGGMRSGGFVPNSKWCSCQPRMG